MIKHLKLIFYITSAVVLGLLTIWQIYSVRQALIAGNGKELDAELDQVRDVVTMWEKRQPFTTAGIEKTATPSGRRITPTPIEAEPTEEAAPQEN